MNKMHFKVSDKIFGFRVHVILNYSKTEFEDFVKKNRWNGAFNYELAEGLSMEIYGENVPSEWLIMIKKYDGEIESMNVLAHEVAHTIIKIWTMNSCVINLITQEFFAISVGQMMEDIMNKVKQKGKV